uniref:Uncharacterized protein n=1 Tax=Nephroselmis olivacea TaxID=31312 RepID=Q9T4T0_NEPOL|nr:hypothetical protein NeolCp096 [Nephroselmis olivacea]NP_050946.1 hypothetical protein NeolCp141 [Nephroselmis olivacea]AAD54872.1 unknown [Nephroselmis olivacea]AAD54917.1 unknown [Nephroselmis olivacea]
MARHMEPPLDEAFVKQVVDGLWKYSNIDLDTINEVDETINFFTEMAAKTLGQIGKEVETRGLPAEAWAEKEMRLDREQYKKVVTLLKQYMRKKHLALQMIIQTSIDSKNS